MRSQNARRRFVKQLVARQRTRRKNDLRGQAVERRKLVGRH